MKEKDFSTLEMKAIYIQKESLGLSLDELADAGGKR